MAMPYHPGYAVHSYSQSSIFPPPPPPLGVSQLEADGKQTLHTMILSHY